MNQLLCVRVLDEGTFRRFCCHHCLEKSVLGMWSLTESEHPFTYPFLIHFQLLTTVIPSVKKHFFSGGHAITNLITIIRK